MASKRDYYEVLGVAKGSAEDDIKRSYRKLAMQFHPDRNPGDDGAQHKFREAAEAYEVLSDPEKRARYDRYGHAGLESMGGPQFTDVESVFDMFGDIFGMGDVFGRKRQRGPRPGRDLQVTVDLTLAEAATGVMKTIAVDRAERCGECNGDGARKGTRPSPCGRCGGRGVVLQRQGFFQMQSTCNACGGSGVIISDPCPSCRGTGRVVAQRKIEVNIPAGVDTGNRIRLSGEGESGAANAPRGDLYCLIRVKPHPFFQRDGNDLLCQVPIGFSQAALGGDIEVPTLKGMESLAIPKGIQAGEVLKIRGKGIADIRGGRSGDLLVQVIIETPKKLTKRQEELFRELAEIDQKNVSPQRKSFLDKVKEWFVPEEEKPAGKPDS